MIRLWRDDPLLFWLYAGGGLAYIGLLGWVVATLLLLQY